MVNSASLFKTEDGIYKLTGYSDVAGVFTYYFASREAVRRFVGKTGFNNYMDYTGD